MSEKPVARPWMSEAMSRELKRLKSRVTSPQADANPAPPPAPPPPPEPAHPPIPQADPAPDPVAASPAPPPPPPAPLPPPPPESDNGKKLLEIAEDFLKEVERLASVVRQGDQSPEFGNKVLLTMLAQCKKHLQNLPPSTGGRKPLLDVVAMYAKTLENVTFEKNIANIRSMKRITDMLAGRKTEAPKMENAKAHAPSESAGSKAASAIGKANGAAVKKPDPVTKAVVKSHDIIVIEPEKAKEASHAHPAAREAHEVHETGNHHGHVNEPPPLPVIMWVPTRTAKIIGAVALLLALIFAFKACGPRRSHVIMGTDYYGAQTPFGSSSGSFGYLTGQKSMKVTKVESVDEALAAIAFRESSNNPGSVSDLNLQNPSLGAYAHQKQYWKERAMNAGVPAEYYEVDSFIEKGSDGKPKRFTVPPGIQYQVSKKHFQSLLRQTGNDVRKAIGLWNSRDKGYVDSVFKGVNEGNVFL